MNVEGARIRIKATVGLGRPAGWPRHWTFRTDEWIWIVSLDYPGEPHRRGGTYEKWSFWTLFDIDEAFIFRAEDVAELELPAGIELPREAVEQAPFTVTTRIGDVGR